MNIEESVKEIEKIKEIFIHLRNYGWINDIKKDINTDNAIQAIEALLTAYEKEKEKNKKIDEFCRKELAFERRLKRENREPDEFNQGRFYVSENIRKIIEEE